MRTLRGISIAVAVVAASAPTFAGAAVPKPACRSTDRTESGLDGQTTTAEVASGANATGFNCNADLVGQYQGEGASWQLTAWKSCAYFDQARNPSLTHPGTVVVDVSDPTNPKATAWLSDPAMLDPWESLKVNPARQLLGGDQGTYGSPGPGFSIYDISADCAHPAAKSAVNIVGSLGHTGQWAPDGKTYYITTIAQTTASLVAVDTTDPANPVAIATYTPPSNVSPAFHDLEFSADGKTAYVGTIAQGPTNGLVILDVSDVQDRVANPTIRLISTLTWDDGSSVSQNSLPIKIAGKPYILFTDESGSAGGGTCDTTGKYAFSYGVPRLIDITDPAHPTTVSKMDMEVSDIANCTASLAVSGAASGRPLFGASCHYCNVDNVDDAKIAACNCFTAGLRLFDIHDPLNPREVGYYKPPAQGTKALPGSQYATSPLVGNPPSFARPVDWASSKPSFPRDRGDTTGDLWTTSQDNGFQVIKLYTAVTVSPKTASISSGGSTTLSADVAGIGKYGGVNWSVQGSGASITDGGVFTASNAGDYQVVATSVIDGTKSDSAAITVSAPAASSGCTVSPSASGSLFALVGYLLLLTRRRRRAP
jgi:hypothetical protein